MSVDDRLREGLTRNASAYQPDVETRLRQVMPAAVRRRRLTVIGNRWMPMAAACAVLVLVLAGIALHVRRTPAPTPTPPVTVEHLTGHLRATLPDRPGALRKDGLAGTWVLHLRPDGTMQVSGPVTYHGVLSAALFDTSGNVLRTSVFGQDLCSGMRVGTYTWHRVGSRVQFAIADDPCPGRVAVLTTVPWRLR